MSAHNTLKRQPSSWHALALASSLLLVLCLQAASVRGSPQPATDASRDDDGDEYFFDADPDALDRMDIDDDNEDEDTWYDAATEIDDDEDAEENVCAGSDLRSCATCCRRLGFDLPHWSAAVGQCSCYLSEADKNVCKAPVANEPSAQTCELCCTENHYEQSFFGQRSRTCYCSLPDEHFYLS